MIGCHSLLVCRHGSPTQLVFLRFNYSTQCRLSIAIAVPGAHCPRIRLHRAEGTDTTEVCRLWGPLRGALHEGVPTAMQSTHVGYYTMQVTDFLHSRGELRWLPSSTARCDIPSLRAFIPTTSCSAGVGLREEDDKRSGGDDDNTVTTELT